ncbi:MAG: AcrR family transcriptional regulator [Planctomycetota bacterium]
MTIADRRARERANRERLIVEHADDLLAQHGYHGFNLDELADRIEYSKATIYNHYDSKEDLLAAVDLRHLHKRADLFGKALIFEGTTRERMFVVEWADRIMAGTFPHWSTLHQLMCTRSFMEKVSGERQKSIGKTSTRCFSVAYEIIRQGRACGELPPEAPPEAQILSGLISLAKGAHLLDESENLPPESGIQPLIMLNENYHIYLDGVGWTPFRNAFDYGATEERIKREVFADELASLAIA